MHDERITWVRDEPGRQVVIKIDPAPCGFSITTEWWERGEKVRQDCEIAIRDATMSGQAKEM